MKWFIPFLLLATLFAGDHEHLDLPALPHPEAAPEQILIKDARVWTMGPDGILEEADILIENGKIKRIRKNINARNALVIDAASKQVTPGIIDAHSHSAVENFGVNEASNNITAEVRIADVLDPFDQNIYYQLAGGTTLANVLHGSANSIGGQSAVIKLRWGVNHSRDLIYAAAPESIKFALGENPKRSAFSFPGVPARYPQTRMGVIASIREIFNEAKDYQAEWATYNALSDKASAEPPRRDLKLEALVEILEGKRLVHSHGYRADEYLSLIRTMESFGIRISTFQHIMEGYRIADEMAKHGVAGSTFTDWWAFKIEAYEAIPYNAALMHERGVNVSVNSDDNTLARRLNVEAAKGLRYGGLSPEVALAMVTINPAQQLGVGETTGSIETGKDADIVIWNDDPLSVYASVDVTIVDGQVMYSRERDLAHREKVAEARAALAKKIRGGGDEEEGETGDEGETEEAAEEADAEDAAEEADAEEAKPLPAMPQRDYAYDPLSGSERIAIVGATVNTMAGDAINNGVVLIENSRIKAVGGADTQIPTGFETVDAKGKHLWPGIIHAGTNMGLTEIDSVSGTIDTAESGDWNTNIHAHLAYHPASALIPVSRVAGITHAHTIAVGGRLTGTGAFMRLQGWTWEETAGVRDIVMGLAWPEGRASGFAAFFGGQRSLADRKKDAEKVIEEIDAYFDDALIYKKAKDASDKPAASFKMDMRFEGMIPVLTGELPLMILANEAWAIKGAVEWARERQLPIIIFGGEQAYRIADYLAENKVSVILNDVLDQPSREDEPFDMAYSAPKILADAGVAFAIAGEGENGGAAHARNIIEHAGFAAAFGLDRDMAYKSITLHAAKVLGLDKHLGSIEVGKSASLVLTDGDLLEVGSTVEQVWIDGVPSDMMDKHRMLYERYRARPKPN